MLYVDLRRSKLGSESVESLLNLCAVVLLKSSDPHIPEGIYIAAILVPVLSIERGILNPLAGRGSLDGGDGNRTPLKISVNTHTDFLFVFIFCAYGVHGNQTEFSNYTV